MKSINKTLSNIHRVLSLLLQGYLFGSSFARFEFRRSFLRPWLNAAGGVLAWALVGLAAVAVFVAVWGLMWLILWLGYDAGMTM